MTRETKIGLVVAGSFLCLVGIVVASKLNRGDGAKNDAEEQTVPKIAAAKPTQNPPPDAKKETTSKKESTPKSSFPSLPPHLEKSTSNPPPLTLPPLINVGGPSQGDTALLLPATPASGLPTPPTLPMPSDAQPSFPINNRPTDVVTPPPMLPLPPALDSFPNAGINAKGPAAVTPPPPLSPLPSVAQEPNRTGSPAVLTFPPPPTLPPSNGSNFGTTAPLADLPKPLTLPPAAKDETPPIQPLTAKIPSPPVSPTMPGITVIPPSDPPTLPRIGSAELPSTPTIPTFPEPGRIPNSVTPPIVIGAANPTMPKVTDVSVDLDVCRQFETNFAILALRFYGADKYGDALLEYNKRHASQVRNGGVFTQSPRALPEGQQVLRPPVGILERDYAAQITGLRPAVPTIPTTVPAVKVGTPSPLAPPAGTPPIVNSVVPTGARVYRVQNPNGESILDIAERQLGDRNRWNEIYRLNPNYQPQFRIPAGTELQIPAPAARPAGSGLPF